jgi:CRP-like cAMP-binding protein
LASLPRSDFEMLKPDLREVRLLQHEVVQEPGEPVGQVYFPLTGMISVLAVLSNGQVVEIAAIGPEGALGASIGNESLPANSKAIVQLSGHALKMPAAKFQKIAKSSPAVLDLASKAQQLLLASIQQTAACNTLHTIETRLARWLLRADDCQSTNELPLTQEFLAEMMGVRRTTVTLTARAFQQEGLIRYRRGNLQITDRAGLEKRACECYRTIRENIEQILGPDEAPAIRQQGIGHG